jgi:glycosyltransferase involved in cell wall biosynthesis
VAADVTVVIPTIPTRQEMLKIAHDSALDQEWKPETVISVIDWDGEGAARTRNRALDAIKTEWTAFLDDDDRFYRNHLHKCLWRAQISGADLVYPMFDCTNRDWHQLDPYLGTGTSFNEEVLRNGDGTGVRNYIPVTVVVRTSLLREVGGFPVYGENCDWEGDEEWSLWLRLLDAGAKFSHEPTRTWEYNHHGGNTSGRSWKA